MTEDPIRVRNETELRWFVTYLLSASREEPVVALTRALGTRGPVLMPQSVRAILGTGARIYFIEQDFLLHMTAPLPSYLAPVPQAARIWWPGLTDVSDADDHPVVPALLDVPDMLGEFARQYRLSHPDVREEIKLIEGVRRLAEFNLAAETERHRETAQHLRDTQIERHETLTRARAAERLIADPSRPLSELDCEQRLHIIINREWRARLGVEDRRTYPLNRYRLSPEFVSVFERDTTLSVDRIGWACAMIVCGYAEELTTIELRPLLAPEVTAGLHLPDGSTGWRCDTEELPTLEYWVRPDTTIEITAVKANSDSGAS